ncbi:helix-turn-helix domain-containing protein [Thalassospira xianhensis]|uniref:HTH cro/C1-type domain-containing protein n=1 Tax=Thalassospira xianhensis MCCC 1A02616 TaxID=1177929 RepID=A0A367UE05_9PROT|nr:helix-turn-helix transcriptional regulator [Thalassospira xianhensis]RCK06389.1 hypothetical protein TH5_09360 [Thalassospira xianhensis MCCC 1A02616]
MSSEEVGGIGRRINLCERIAGSRLALAAKTGISARTLENYSHGRNDPKASACVQIAAATGVSVQWLLTGSGEVSKVADETTRKIVFNIAYYLARSSDDVKVDPNTFADSFLALFDYSIEKEANRAFNVETFENVVEFASKRFQQVAS